MPPPLGRVALFSLDLATGTYASAFSGLAHALVAGGVEAIDLVSVRGDMTAPRRPFPSGARVHVLERRDSATAIPALARYLTRHQPSHLIAGPMTPNFGAVLAARLARRWRGRVIVSHHHPPSGTRRWRWKSWVVLERWLYPFADASFAVSPFVRDDAIATLGLDPRRVGLIPNVFAPSPPMPSDEPPHPWLARPRRHLAVITIGPLRAVKNLPLLLAALAEVGRRHPVRLLILGRGPEVPALRARIEALGLGEAVAFTGFVPSVAPYLEHADVFALTSREEGFSQVLLEAMAAGLPVISTDAFGGGPRFVLDGGRAGLLVPGDDAEALIAALRRFTDPAVRREYAARARCRTRTFLPQAVGPRLCAWLATVPAKPQVERGIALADP